MRFLPLASWRRAARNSSGVAALEMALLLPIVLLIFLGMIDLTALIADSRRVTYASNVAADAVTRLVGNATNADLNNAYAGVNLVMAGGTTGAVRVEIHTFDYNKDSGSTSLRWKDDNETGNDSDCPDPSEESVKPLMQSQGNDVVVAVVCTTHAPIVTNAITEYFMGSAEIRLQRQVTMRPRLTMELPYCNC